MKPQRQLFRWWVQAAWAVFAGLWLTLAQAATETAVLPIQVSTLSNGMTLIVQPDRGAPTVVHMVWYRVGAMDEPDGVTGVAHVLEHMMFKGTPRVPEGEFSRQVAAMGGRDNAFTSRDYTAYYQQVPADRLGDVMRLEADRMANNQWSDDAFRRERAVVQEERRQRIEESPQAQLFEQFQAMSWLVHPYRRPIIGWPDDLAGLQPDDVRAFYKRWYRPENAAIVVVGDVDAGQVRRLAEQHYGALAGHAAPERRLAQEPPQSGVRRVEFRGRTQQPLVLMGYRAPSLSDVAANDASSRDALALVLLAGVLDGHSAARLDRALVQGHPVGGEAMGERLADSVGASYGLMGRGPQSFVISAAPKAGVPPQRLEVALRAELERVARDGVTEAELRRVKNQWMASEVFKRDSLFAQARELGSHWALGWPLNASEKLRVRLDTVTPQEVQSVAQRYFRDTQLTVATLLPQEDKP